MPSFKAGGREWLLRVDGPSIRACITECGVDIGAYDCSQFEVITSKPLVAMDVLWVLCRQQAQAASVSREQFEGGLVGDDGEAASNCLLEAIIDFFPSRQQAVLRDMLAKNREVAAAAQEAAAKRLTSKATVEAMKKAAVDEVNAAIDAALSKLTPPRGVTS